MDEHFRDPLKIHPHFGNSLGDLDPQFMLGQHLRGFLKRSLDDLQHWVWFAMQLDFLGIELRHFGGFSNQSVQAIGLLVDDRQQVAASGVINFRPRHQRGH